MGTPIRWKRKPEAERESPNEEHMAASRSDPLGQTDVVRVREGTHIPEGIVEQGREPTVTPDKEVEPLDVKQHYEHTCFH